MFVLLTTRRSAHCCHSRSGKSVLTFAHTNASWVSLGAHAVARGKRSNASFQFVSTRTPLHSVVATRADTVHCTSQLFVAKWWRHKQASVKFTATCFRTGRWDSVAKRARTLHSLAIVIEQSSEALASCFLRVCLLNAL